MRPIDADALIAEWYKLNNIGPEDCGARFVGYQEIARLINNAPTASHKTVGRLAGRHFGLRAKECRYSEIVSWCRCIRKTNAISPSPRKGRKE